MKQPCGEDSCFECPFYDCILDGNNKPRQRELEKIKRKTDEQKTDLHQRNNLSYA